MYIFISQYDMFTRPNFEISPMTWYANTPYAISASM